MLLHLHSHFTFRVFHRYLVGMQATRATVSIPFTSLIGIISSRRAKRSRWLIWNGIVSGSYLPLVLPHSPHGLPPWPLRVIYYLLAPPVPPQALPAQIATFRGYVVFVYY